MKRKIKLLYLAWIIDVVMVVAITIMYRGEFTEFYGIAETREITVCSESAVEIGKLHVVS